MLGMKKAISATRMVGTQLTFKRSGVQEDRNSFEIITLCVHDSVGGVKALALIDTKAMRATSFLLHILLTYHICRSGDPFFQGYAENPVRSCMPITGLQFQRDHLFIVNTSR